MKQYIGCDGHKQYSVFVAVDELGRVSPAQRVRHERNEFRDYVRELPPGSPIALETSGHWYWMVEAMEQAGHHPVLVHARKAKLLMGLVNKTDKLDARGLATLLRNGTVPAVWIPPGALRDQRELPRLRMTFVRVRTALKNRTHAAFAKYGIAFPEVSDLFGTRGRQLLEQRLPQLPPETQCAVRDELALLDPLQDQIDALEVRIQQVVRETPLMEQLQTLPGVGPILAIVIAWELGTIERFPNAEHFASYSGTVPRVVESGGHRRYCGAVRQDVNHYLKWAFVEAANCIVLNQARWEERHVVQLYQRLHRRKGHAKAIVAVARHLAEATFWMLKRQEPYREPAWTRRPVSRG
jgi:transposase